MKNIQSIISSKYQVVIPAEIRKKLNIKPGAKLIWRIINLSRQPKIIAEPVPKSWSKYSRGLGQNIWKMVDIKQYIEDLRSQWEK